MEAVLTSILGSVPLRHNALTIGRSPNNGLFINHATVSRHHAEVRPDERGFYVIDLGSTTGTFVNGERLIPRQPHLLRVDDELRVGNLSLSYKEPHAAHSPGTAMAAPAIAASKRPAIEHGARAASGADHPLAISGSSQNSVFIVPEALSLSPVSDGQLHAPGPHSASEQRGVAGGSLPNFPSVPVSEAPFAGAFAQFAPSFSKSLQIRPLDLTQQQLRFTAFYPRAVPVETWQTLLVYAHLEARLEAVRGDAQRWQELEADPSQFASPPVPLLNEGTRITIVPVFQGVTFQPERINFTWTNDWHPAPVRFCASRQREGTLGTGEILIMAGPLVIAALRVSLRFAAPGEKLEAEQAEVSVARYKNIFTSYCPDDTCIAQAIRQTYEAIGDDSFLDIEALRSSQNWENILSRPIDSADVFQLFWSSKAAQSQCVYQECRYALQHYKYDGFIRPIYWQKPLEFAPPEFSHLHFTYYNIA
ncbi:MAG TPA: FHA domain-containing protein [Ktedonobacteraceae bacterium]